MSEYTELLKSERDRFHEVANIFPLISEAELRELASDIAEHGQDEPIWLHPDDGRVVDGRNRWLACCLAGVDPAVRTWHGEGDLTRFVVSANLRRRHLNEAQRAAAALEALPHYEAEAKEREKLSNSSKASLPDSKKGQARDKAGEDFKVSGRTIQDAKKIKAEDEDVYALIRDGLMAVAMGKRLLSQSADVRREAVAKIRDGAKPMEALREAKAEEIRASSRLQDPSGKYRVIYADPPWSYGNSLPPIGVRAGATEARDHYPTMSTDEICDLPVREMADDNAVLFMWTTSPHLEESFRVINAWGFKYKASFVWDKVKHNMGHYNSVRHEFLLIGVRGSCQPDVRKQFDSVVEEPRTQHSRKPDFFYEIIETIYPHGARVELFARRPRDGWGRWGYEANGVAP